jgi:hypothetical protein
MHRCLLIRILKHEKIGKYKTRQFKAINEEIHKNKSVSAKSLRKLTEEIEYKHINNKEKSGEHTIASAVALSGICCVGGTGWLLVAAFAWLIMAGAPL